MVVRRRAITHSNAKGRGLPPSSCCECCRVRRWYDDRGRREDSEEAVVSVESARQGPLPFRADHNLAFGTSWNTADNYRDGMNFSRWAGTQPNIRFAATVEIPYANVSGQPVTPESARAFGADLATALREFFESP